MFASPWPWSKTERRKLRRQRPAVRKLQLEELEDRTLLAGHTLGTATLLTFNPANSVQASGFLAAPDQADLYRVSLEAGERLTAAVAAQNAGSALDSALRVFRSDGTPLFFNDNF